MAISRANSKQIMIIGCGSVCHASDTSLFPQSPNILNTRESGWKKYRDAQQTHHAHRRRKTLYEPTFRRFSLPQSSFLPLSSRCPHRYVASSTPPIHDFHKSSMGGFQMKPRQERTNAKRRAGGRQTSVDDIRRSSPSRVTRRAAAPRRRRTGGRRGASWSTRPTSRRPRAW